ncbi:MAG: PAS domain S-box protein [Planctomycetes bacterium]|nr:PAS domain S-box protein [Planctomycetota bacterium]
MVERAVKHKRTPPHGPSDSAPETDSATAAPASSQGPDFGALFDGAADARLILNGDRHCLCANRAAAELTGYSADELRAMRLDDLHAPAESEDVSARFREAQSAGSAGYSARILHKDGSVETVEVRLATLGDGLYEASFRGDSGQPAGRETLGASLDAYSLLVEICHAAVISADHRGRITSVNHAAELLFGYSAKEAVGMPITTLIPAHLRGTYQTALERHMAGRPAERFARTLTSVGLRKDGSQMPVEVAVAAGRRGADPTFTAVIRDLTEQEAVLNRLNDAWQRLQFHVERMPLAYITWDTNFRAVEWNPAAARIFGYTREEAVGKHAYELVVPADAVPAVEQVWAGLLKGDTSSHSINPNVRKDGSRLTCEWFNTPLRDPVGRVMGVASMAMDVSERELLETQLRNAQKLESLGVLAGGVAHDFNSSLMVILGNTSLLRAMKGLPPRALENIELIEEAGLRANHLIKHLLTFAQTGRHSPQPTDLNALIRDALRFVGSSVGPMHELQLELAESLPEVLADRGQMEQILLNLCMNAKQAQPEGGPIVISTRAATLAEQQIARCVPHDARPGRYVELSVQDSGCGMSPATVARIFDPFFTTKSEGHGLGLAAVLGILRQHRGAALVDSAPGKGTRIRVYLPALDAPVQQEP